MKRLFLMVLLGVGFAFNTLASDEPTQEFTVASIEEAQCVADRGLGIIRVRKFYDTEMRDVWYKVNSQSLCGDKQWHPAFFGEVSAAVRTAADNSVSLIKMTHVLFLNEDGYVVSAKEFGKVDYTEQYEKAGTHIVEGAEDANYWYHLTVKGAGLR